MRCTLGERKLSNYFILYNFKTNVSITNGKNERFAFRLLYVLNTYQIYTNYTLKL